MALLADVRRRAGHETEERVRLKLLRALLSASTSGLPGDAVVQLAVHELGLAFPRTRVTYSVIDGRDRMRAAASTAPHSQPPARRRGDLSIAHAFLGRLEAGEVVSVPDVSAEPALVALLGQLAADEVAAFVDVPIREGSKLVGLLAFDSPVPRAWTKHEVRTIAEVGEQLALVVSDARSRDARQRADKILHAVSHAAARLLRERSWEAAAPDLLRGLGEAMGVSRAYVFEYSARADGAVIASQRYEWAAPSISPQLDSSLLQGMDFGDAGLGRLWETVAAGGIFALDARDFSDSERSIFEPQGIRSLMTVPIHVEGRGWGHIGLDECVRDREWSAAEIDALRAASAILAAAIERERSEHSLREHEHKLNAVFETALDAILITNDDRRYVDVNPAACTLFGRKRDEIVGHLVVDFLPPDRQETFEEDWAEYLRGETITAEWELLHSSGAVKHVEASSRPQFVPGLHIAFARDVTERKRLEHELLEAQKLESIGRLAGGVAHDFNNLLTAIGGYTDLLLERAGSDEALTHDLSEIRSATTRATELTRQLLAFARRDVLQPRPLDLNALVSGIGTMLARLLGEQIELVVLPGDIGTVRADPGRLEQVLVNLAVNARDAMPDGGTLTIATRSVERKGSRFTALDVSDSGVGMDDETRLRIFDPFFTTREAGVGLGLASAHGVVRQSGGEIEVQSSPGQGTTFTIYLPVVDEEVAATPDQRPRPANEPGSETVLLVEDERTVRALTRRMLEQRGYSVLEAGEGVEAVAVAATHPGPIDLLLTDVVMPGLRGHEVAVRVAAVRPDIPVVYMSGYADEAVLRATAASGSAFIEKPFSAETLAARVRAALDGAKSMR